MSHFYGTVSGSRGMATRMGSKNSGLRVNAAGWGGSIRVQLCEDHGKDTYTVSLVPWQSSGGQSRVIAEGPLDANADEFITRSAAMGSRDLEMLEVLEVLEVLEAIVARIDGVYDAPALLKMGELSISHLVDIKRFAKAGIAKALEG